MKNAQTFLQFYRTVNWT